MKARARQLAMALFAAATVGAVGCWLAGEPRTPVRLSTSSGLSIAVPAAPREFASVRTPARSMPTADRAPTNPSSRMAREFAQAKDWRAFAVDAKTRPEEGGHFYALFAAAHCASQPSSAADKAGAAAAAEVARSGTVSAAQLERMTRAAALCAGFPEAEARAMVRDLKAAGADGRDPLLAARKTVADAYMTINVEQTKRALTSLMSLGDALALHADGFLMAAMVHASENDSAFAYWFDGRLYENADRMTPSVALAASVAACKGQEFCEIDQEMANSCLFSQACHESRMAFWRDAFVDRAGFTETEFKKALLLADRMHAAIEARRVDAFIR